MNTLYVQLQVTLLHIRLLMHSVAVYAQGREESLTSESVWKITFLVRFGT